MRTQRNSPEICRWHNTICSNTKWTAGNAKWPENKKLENRTANKLWEDKDNVQHKSNPTTNEDRRPDNWKGGRI